MRKIFLILMLVALLAFSRPTKTYPIGETSDHPYESTADTDTLIIDTLIIDNAKYSECILAVWVKEISGGAFSNDSLTVYIDAYKSSVTGDPDTAISHIFTEYLAYTGDANIEICDTLNLTKYMPWCEAFVITIMTNNDPGTDTTYVYPFYTVVERQ